MRRIYLAKMFPAVMLIAFIALNFFSITPITRAQFSTMIAVDPQRTRDPALVPGSTFSIDVNITNVFNLLGYEFKLAYNPAILQVPNLTSIAVGDFFPDPMVWTKSLDNTAGFVWLAIT